MRGYRWLILLLALLSAGLLTAADLTILDTADQVTVEREVLAGEPDAAAGVEVTLPLSCGDHLFWTTTFPADRPEEAATDFTYTLSRDYRIAPWDQQPLSVEVLDSYYWDLGYGEESDPSSFRDQLFQQAQDAAPAYQDSTFTFWVRDYFDSWPLRVTADRQKYTAYAQYGKDSLSQLFQSYFSIPVSSDARITVTIHNLSGGGTSYDEIGIPQRLDSFSAPCGDSILFAVANTASVAVRDEAGNFQRTAMALDGSQIPGGWGLYRYIPNEDYTGGTLETLWSLPDGAEILEFWGAEDEEEFFLLTREEKQLRLRVFDGDGNLLQAMDPLPLSDEESYMQTYKGDGFFVPTIYDPRDEGYRYHFAVVSKCAEDWSLAFTGDDRQADSLGYGGFSWVDNAYGGLIMAFDGERLVIRDSAYSDSDPFWLAIYTKDGLDYLATYRNSVSQAADNSSGPTFYDTARPFWIEEPQVRWTETAS